MTRLALAILAIGVVAATTPAAPVPVVDDLEQVRQILREIEVPLAPLSRGPLANVRPPDLPRVSKVLEAYRPDRAVTPLRTATVKARESFAAAMKDIPIMEDVPAAVNVEAFRTILFEHQKKVARAAFLLTQALEELQAVEGKRAKEPSRRWQAHHAYLTGRLQMQIAFLYEYQTALGYMRRELPELGEGHTGWRLMPNEGMRGDRAGKQLAAASRKTFEKLVEDHPDTPWAELGRLSLKTPLGLEWRSTKLD